MSDLTQLNEKLDLLNDNSKKQLAVIKEYEKRLAQGEEISEDLRKELAEVSAREVALREQVNEWMAKNGRPNFNKKTSQKLSDLLVGSDQYQAYRKSGGHDMAKLDIEGGLGQFRYRRKDLTQVTGGAAVQEDRLPGIVDIQFRELTIRDLLRSRPTTSNAIEFVRETRWNQIASLSTTAMTGGADDTVTVQNITGFKVGSTVTLDPDGTGNGPEQAVILSVTSATATDPTGDIQFTANVTNSHAIGTLIVSDEFQMTPDTFLKPGSDILLSLVTENVKTLAHYLIASRTILDDAAGLRDHVDMRLMQGLALEVEKQILYGDGSATQLRGILNDPSVQTYNIASGPASDQRQDAIRRAINLAQISNYPVDGIIMHPNDWMEVEIAKDVDNRYIVTTQVANGAVQTLWRVPVVVTTAIDSGTALVGSFGLGAVLADREMANVRVSESHDQLFLRNMLAILAEERLAMLLIRPDAFVNVTLV